MVRINTCWHITNMVYNEVFVYATILYLVRKTMGIYHLPLHIHVTVPTADPSAYP